VQDSGQTIPKAQQMHTGPVLDVCWSDVCLVSSFKIGFVLLTDKQKIVAMSKHQGYL
jgi:hypothetical protein